MRELKWRGEVLNGATEQPFEVEQAVGVSYPDDES